MFGKTCAVTLKALKALKVAFLFWKKCFLKCMYSFRDHSFTLVNISLWLHLVSLLQGPNWAKSDHTNKQLRLCSAMTGSGSGAGNRKLNYQAQTSIVLIKQWSCVLISKDCGLNFANDFSKYQFRKHRKTRFVSQIQEKLELKETRSILALWIWKKLLIGFREKR